MDIMTVENWFTCEITIYAYVAREAVPLEGFGRIPKGCSSNTATVWRVTSWTFGRPSYASHETRNQTSIV